MDKVWSKSERNLSVLLRHFPLFILATEEILIYLLEGPVLKSIFLLQSKTKFRVCESKLATSLAENECVQFELLRLVENV